LRVDGEQLTIIINHFKSKRGGELETAPRRLAQAHHVHDLVQNHLANDPQAGIIVLGDFNDFNLSAVWQQLQEGGVLFDIMQTVPSQERYSYIFDGASQLVDGILVSPALVHRVAQAAIPHVNADYPITFALDDSPSGLPYYASDHDPVILTINKPLYSDVNETATPTATRTEITPAITTQPATLTPEIEQPATATQPATLTPEIEEPASTIHPKAPMPIFDESLPTVPPADPRQVENEAGSRQYLFIAGFVLVLAATAVLWLARRISK
jgi:hypothetical protein